MEALVTALNTGFGTMVTDAFDGLGTIIPTVIPLFGALIVISIIIRVVQRLTGRRA